MDVCRTALCNRKRSPTSTGFLKLTCADTAFSTLYEPIDQQGEQGACIIYELEARLDARKHEGCCEGQLVGTPAMPHGLGQGHILRVLHGKQ